MVFRYGFGLEYALFNLLHADLHPNSFTNSRTSRLYRNPLYSAGADSVVRCRKDRGASASGGNDGVGVVGELLSTDAYGCLDAISIKTLLYALLVLGIKVRWRAGW